MVNTNIKIIFGGGGLGHPEGGWSTKENIEELLKVLEEEGIKVIDTAQAYGASETFLGESNAASRFVIDTKYPGGLIPREATKETIITSGEDSLKKLKTDCVRSPNPGPAKNKRVIDYLDCRSTYTISTHQITRTLWKNSSLGSTLSTSLENLSVSASPTSQPRRSKT
jgi:hypothetical protein